MEGEADGTKGGDRVCNTDWTLDHWQVAASLSSAYRLTHRIWFLIYLDFCFTIYITVSWRPVGFIVQSKICMKESHTNMKL